MNPSEPEMPAPSTPIAPVATRRPLPSTTPPLRFLLTGAGLAIAAVDVLLALAVGVEFELNGRDATLLVWLYLGASFGVLGYFVGAAIDAQRKAAELAAALSEQLAIVQDAQVRLARGERLAFAGQLAAAIAHEVRNPMAIVRSSIQNVAEALPSEDAESRESCAFALEEIDRLTRVASTLLGFARPLAPRRAPRSPGEILDRVELLAAGLLESKALTVLRAERTARTLAVDADLVCQALLGLIDNAVETSPERAVVELEVVEADGAVELAVSDAGPGVPDDAKPRVFEPFFTTRASGHGLGLAVVQQIAAAHGGEVVVADRPTGGARFALRLPLEVAA